MHEDDDLELIALLTLTFAFDSMSRGVYKLENNKRVSIVGQKIITYWW